MTNDQRQKIAEHLRAIGDVLTQVGHGSYSVDVQSTEMSTMGKREPWTLYTLQMTAHSQETIQ